MQTRKFIYTCDNCGAREETSRSLDWPQLVLIDGNDKRVGTWDFCSPVCKAEWLKEHGFEVKE
jgi:hypothetical protein